MDAWLDEFVMCGWPWPVTRRSAVAEMVKDGFTLQEAVEAMCWYKAVTP